MSGYSYIQFEKKCWKIILVLLKKIASLGYKEIESAGSDKGNYYGLKPSEIKKITKDLGMNLRSGHVHFDDKWQQTIDDALEAGQEYVIVSSMPTKGQTVDNYKSVAESFNKAGEACKKSNLYFGYHNHDFEFEKENGKILYDVLVENTNPEFVNLEMDLGWVIVTGNNPLDYFAKYPGPLSSMAPERYEYDGKAQYRIWQRRVRYKEDVAKLKKSGDEIFLCGTGGVQWYCV